MQSQTKRATRTHPNFSVDAVRFGLQTLAPKFFDCDTDFVVSGPNVGSQSPSFRVPSMFAHVLTCSLDNLGTVTLNSGTVYVPMDHDRREDAC